MVHLQLGDLSYLMYLMHDSEGFWAFEETLLQTRSLFHFLSVTLMVLSIVCVEVNHSIELPLLCFVR